MKSIKSEFAFHFPHDQLVGFCPDYDERVKVIKEDKPQDEQALRLRLLQIIPGSRLPRPLIKAGKTYHKAREAYYGAKKVYDEAWETYHEVLKVCEPELIKLHEELCPNCPWNGSTIFTRRDENNQWY